MQINVYFLQEVLRVWVVSQRAVGTRLADNSGGLWERLKYNVEYHCGNSWAFRCRQIYRRKGDFLIQENQGGPQNKTLDDWSMLRIKSRLVNENMLVRNRETKLHMCLFHVLSSFCYFCLFSFLSGLTFLFSICLNQNENTGNLKFLLVNLRVRFKLFIFKFPAWSVIILFY